MKKYLFITYGEPGWRGVQVRAMRIAAYFPSDEVLFWNMNDSEFIKAGGFAVEDKLPGITLSADIIFPKDVDTVIFADLPSNEFFQFSVYQKALSHGMKIVICEQLYRRGQMREGVFRTFAKNSDLFLLNSLSFFKTEEAENIKIVPPQIEFTPSEAASDEIRALYHIPKDAFLFVGLGYHPEVMSKIKTVTKKLAEQKLPVYTIIVGGDNAGSEINKQENYRIIPFAEGQDYVDLLVAADAVFCKFGFLQILETLALGKPTIVLGEGGFLLKNEKILDAAYKKVLRFDPDITADTYEYLEKIVTDRNFRKDLVEKIKKLHNGELFGGKKAAEAIKSLITQKKQQKTRLALASRDRAKKLAILVNNEIFEKQQWISEQENIYPLCFVTAMSTDVEVVKRLPPNFEDRKIREFQYENALEILPHSFKHIYLFSKRKYDGLCDISDWFDDFVDDLERLILRADEIYLSHQGMKIVGNLLQNEKIRSKIRFNRIKITIF